MKTLSVLCVVISIGLSTTATFGRGGMGSHHMSVSGGAFGTTAAAPGTNSLGTALSSSGIGAGPMKGPLLGTNPAIDREEAKVDKTIGPGLLKRPSVAASSFGLGPPICERQDRRGSNAPNTRGNEGNLHPACAV